MAEMTNERLRELLNIFAQHWQDCLQTHPTEYWELHGYISDRIEKISGRRENRYLMHAVSVHSFASDFTGLLRVSKTGKSPKLARVPENIQFIKSYVNKVCLWWMGQLAKTFAGKEPVKYNDFYSQDKLADMQADMPDMQNDMSEMDQDQLNLKSKMGKLKNQIDKEKKSVKDAATSIINRIMPSDEPPDELYRSHFGLTTNSQEMDKALDSADKETTKQQLLHAMVLVTMYASARVIPSQIREHPKRKISRPSETIISACVDSMHVHWGQEPMAAGLPICSRISAEDLVELLVSVGVKEIGPSTEMNAVRAFEKSVSRCREQLVQIISELFPLDCHN
jgi:hypothetical protein